MAGLDVQVSWQTRAAERTRELVQPRPLVHVRRLVLVPRQEAQGAHGQDVPVPGRLAARSDPLLLPLTQVVHVRGVVRPGVEAAEAERAGSVPARVVVEA